jgi:hypothetical protein
VVVPALVFPAVDLAWAVAGTLVFGAVDFLPVGHFSFGQVLGHLAWHALYPFPTYSASTATSPCGLTADGSVFQR